MLPQTAHRLVSLTCVVHLLESGLGRPALVLHHPKHLPILHHPGLALTVVVELYPSPIAIPLDRREGGTISINKTYISIRTRTGILHLIVLNHTNQFP